MDQSRGGHSSHHLSGVCWGGAGGGRPVSTEKWLQCTNAALPSWAPEVDAGLGSAQGSVFQEQGRDGLSLASPWRVFVCVRTYVCVHAHVS